MKVRIYDYLDSRRYLNDYFNERKRLEPIFSHRYFAKLAKSNSSGLLKDIINGRSNMEKDIIERYSKALRLGGNEARYFKNLVYFTQAKTTLEKNYHFEILMRAFRKKGHIIPVRQYEYYSKWYYPAIRELLGIFDFKSNYVALARKLKPRITSQQARAAIKMLVRHGFIRKDASGFYRPVMQTVTTGPEVQSLIVSNFQRAMLQLCIEAIDRFPPEDRDISTLTFSVAKKDIGKMKTEIRACRQRLMGIIQRSKKMDTICQFNFGLFPLSSAEN